MRSETVQQNIEKTRTEITHTGDKGVVMSRIRLEETSTKRSRFRLSWDKSKKKSEPIFSDDKREETERTMDGASYLIQQTERRIIEEDKRIAEMNDNVIAPKHEEEDKHPEDPVDKAQMLSNGNFNTFVQSNELVLVNFYATFFIKSAHSSISRQINSPLLTFSQFFFCQFFIFVNF